MKELCLLSVVILVTSAAAISQQTPTSVYDIFKLLSVKGSAADGFTPGDWSIATTKSAVFNWAKKDGLEWTDSGFMQKGVVKATLPDKKLDCVEKATQKQMPCPWIVVLTGPRAGYFEFTVSSVPHSNLSAGFGLDSLFGKSPYQAKLISTCKGAKPFEYYQLTLPGKAPMGVKLVRACSGGKCAIVLYCKLDANEPAPACQ